MKERCVGLALAISCAFWPGAALASGGRADPLVAPGIGRAAVADVDVVRYAYAKLGFYLERKLKRDNRDDVATAIVQLSNVRTGSVEEIGATPLSDLVSLRSDDQRSLQRDVLGFTVDKDATDFTSTARHVDYRLRWQTAVSLASNVEVPPFADAAKHVGLDGYERYVSYEVSLSWDGKKVQYRALALFSSRTAQPEFWDTVVGDLTAMFSQSIPPEPLPGQARERSAPPPFRNVEDVVCRGGVCCELGTSVCLWQAGAR